METLVSSVSPEITVGEHCPVLVRGLSRDFCATGQSSGANYKHSCLRNPPCIEEGEENHLFIVMWGRWGAAWNNL